MTEPATQIGRADGPAPSRLRRWARQALRLALLAAVAVFVVRALARGFGQVDWAHIHFRWERVALSFLCVMASLSMPVAYNRVFLASVSHDLPLSVMAGVTWISRLGKYIPGKAASILGAAYMLRDHGVPGPMGASITLLTTILSMLVGLVVAAPLMLWQPVRSNVPLAWAWMLLMVAAGAAAVHPAVLFRGVNFLLKRLGKPPLAGRPRLGAYIRPLGLILVQWALAGVGLWMLAWSLTPMSVRQIPVMIATTSLAIAVGFLAIFTPSGLGVREGVNLLLLTPLLGAGPAAILAVAIRIVYTLVEVTLALAGLAILRLRGQGQANGPRPASAPPRPPTDQPVGPRPAPPPAPLLALPGLPGPEPSRRTVILVGACLAVVYLFQVTGYWWPSPDSALYLGLGRSLAEGQGYRFNGQVHNFVTPGLPAILAGLRLAFGPGHYAPNLFMALCGLGALTLAYLTLARLAGRRLALLVTLVTALSFNFLFYCRLVITDGPFALLFWAILYACLRYYTGHAAWLALAVLLTVLAIVLRVPGIVLLGPLAVALLAGTGPGPALRKRLAGAGGVLAAACLTTGAFYLLARWAVADIPPYLAKSIARPGMDLTRRVREFFEGLLATPVAFTEMLTDQSALAIGLILLALALVGMVVLWRAGRRIVPAVILLTFCALSVVKGSLAVRTRYLMPIQPLVLYAVLTGLLATAAWAWKQRGRVLPPKAAVAAALVLAGTLLALNAPRVLRDSLYYGWIGHFSDRYYQVIRKGTYAELAPAAQAMRDHCPPQGAILMDHEKTRTFHYLSGKPVVSVPGREADRRTADDAEAYYRRILDGPPCPLVVVNTEDGRAEFRARLRELFDRCPAVAPLYLGPRHYRVYRRIGPEETPMAQSAAAGGERSR